MRIAFFTDAYHPRVSGLVSSLDEFMKGFQARGHEVLIVCPTYPKARMGGRLDPPNILRVPAMMAVVDPEDRLALPWTVRNTMAKVEAFHPDIVHIQTEFSIGNMGRRYAHEHGLAVVSTCHTHYEMYISNYVPLPPFIGKQIVRTATRILHEKDDYLVVPSRHIESVLRSYGITKDCAIIPTGVDDGLFRPCPAEAGVLREALAERYPKIKEGPLLVYVGRMGHEKNVRLLIEAFSLVLGEFPEACLLMVGDGPATRDVKRLAHERRVSHRLIMTGYVARERLPAYYSMADVFTFPSATETQGLVTIESMLCGTPVVGVNEMGTAEVMEGERGGLLAANNKADYAGKVLRLLRDPDLLARKSTEALVHGKEWTVAASCSRLEALYEDALGKEWPKRKAI